ncbi:MAG: hypothetical protein JSU96_08410 [Acidobacteriota bacterium]|nr:MAG: hypothetical protein JSU96_08410 [Acidobacteriota bacterium]
MKRATFIALTLVVVLGSGSIWGQKAPQEERHLWRYVGLAGGAFGGIVVGWSFVDDDAINAERKLATSLSLCAIGGAIGGYLLGRAIDKSTTSYAYKADAVQKQQALRSWAKEEVERLNLADAGSLFRPQPKAESTPGD